MSNPEALRAAMNPENLQAVMQMQQAMQQLQSSGLVPPGGGQGAGMPGLGGAGTPSNLVQIQSCACHVLLPNFRNLYESSCTLADQQYIWDVKMRQSRSHGQVAEAECVQLCKPAGRLTGASSLLEDAVTLRPGHLATLLASMHVIWLHCYRQLKPRRGLQHAHCSNRQA